MFTLGKTVCFCCNRHFWEGISHCCGKTVCCCCNRHFWEGIAHCCGSCLTCGCSRNRPSPIFLIFSIILCAIPGIASFVVAVPNFGECDKKVPLFLVIFAALDILYLFFAFYLYHRFSKPYDPTRPHERNPFSRAWHACCFDPWVSLFIVGLIGGIVAASIGLASMAKADCGSKDIIPSMARIVSGLFFLYFFGGILVIFISLGIECIRRGNVTGNGHLTDNAGASGTSGGPPYQGPGTVDRLQGVIGRLFYPLHSHPPQFAPPAPPVGMPMSGAGPAHAQPYPPHHQQPVHQAQYHGGQPSGWMGRLRANFGPGGYQHQPVNHGQVPDGFPVPVPPPYAAQASTSPYHQPVAYPLTHPSVPPPSQHMPTAPPPIYVAKIGGGGGGGDGGGRVGSPVVKGR